MQIAIIGAGNVGGALARGWARAGHKIVLGVRDPENASVAALGRETGAQLLPPAEAAAAAEIVVLALPWNVAEQAIRSLGGLSGKIVIDCMNPLAMHDGIFGLDRGFSTSGGETVAAWIPGARVVKTLNQVGAEIMEHARRLSAPPVMFVAGDDEDANKIVTVLVEALGFDTLNAGRLRQARLLEPLAMVWINQALLRGAGRDWAFSRTSRTT
ncbi:MAG: NADPH-dependent F420 reductase [Hyphomonadaceae bacterium]